MMFREKSISKLYAFALAAVFALTLAGCGGGGGTAQEPMTEPTPEEMCTAAGNNYVGGECLTDAQVTYNEALAAIMAATTAEAAQAAYDAVKGDVSASDGEKLQAAVDARVGVLATMARADEQKMNLTAAAGMIETSDLSTQEAVDTARAAIVALRGALDEADDVSDADKAMYQMQLDDAVAAVDSAQDGINTATRRTNQMAALTGASGTLQTALAALSGSTPTKAQLDAANNALTALNTAITGAEDLTEAEKATYVREAGNAAAPIRVAQMAFDNAEDEATMAERMAMTETGKLLYAALGPPAASDTSALDNIAAPVLTSTLAIDAAAGAGTLGETDDPESVTLRASGSAGALGSWNGMDYALSSGTGDDKVTNEARVYTNRGAAETDDFGDVHTLTDGSLAVADSAEARALVMAAAFTHQGTQNHAVPDKSDAVYVSGTYDGAPGEFRCETGCSSTNDGKGSPSGLGGTWTFTPDKGAMVSQPDGEYLYYGWWVSKDSDGEPTAASAFAGVVEPNSGDLDNGGDLTTITGSATYAGHAVGKFAMSNPLDGTGNGGHFTADAELSATFGTGTTAGVTGTIDNFRLNDGSEDPGWSVSLARGGLAAAGAITAPAANPTVWSINGNKAPASGTWSGTMYDEMPGDPPGGDGSNIPTTVTGTFASEFSTIGRMVGAFGANKQ